MMSSKLTRREILQMGVGAGSAMVLGKVVSAAGPTNQNKPVEQATQPAAGNLNVAVVQFKPCCDLAENTKRHCDFIRSGASGGARVVVFPEYSLVGYFEEEIKRVTPAQIASSEAAIAAAAKEANAYAILGSLTKQDSTILNSAVVMAPNGRVIERYHKVHLAGETYATPGDHLSVFPIDGVLCSIIICHDERYPELVRLPVLAGARVIFYISWESDITVEHKLVPYRAQIVARAEENSVYIAHANVPADKKTPEAFSHGQSRLIAPDGNIIREAGIFDEEVLHGSFDLSKSTGNLANCSLNCRFLQDWWEQGLAKVKMVKG